MGLAYNTYLTSDKIYGCRLCKTHLANHEDIISRVSSLIRARSPPPPANNLPAYQPSSLVARR